MDVGMAEGCAQGWALPRVPGQVGMECVCEDCQCKLSQQPLPASWAPCKADAFTVSPGQ